MMKKAIFRMILFASLAAAPLLAQVVTPMELQDPKLQHLQQRHLQTLMDIGREIEQHKFPYPFYLCRTLDIDIDKMHAADQRSIRFDIYQQRTVLSITGNYYASYAAERMGPDARLKETFQQVIVPLLQAETPRFPDDSEFSAFAIEVSHHVRRKLSGMSSEVPENVMLIIPVLAAQKFVDAKTDDERQGAMLDAEVYLNGEAHAIWLREGAPPDDWNERYPARPAAKVQTVGLTAPAAPAATAGKDVAKAILNPTPARIITPESLAGLQRQNQDNVDRLVKAIDPQAHFVPYAPPSFIGFRQGTYLQLSTSTPLEVTPASSRYKLAALAFDEHIAHLIRPLLNYFPPEVGFDGVDFSTTVHITGDAKGDGKSEGTAKGSSEGAGENRSLAVEFFFPYRMMRCFATYDCTGQQLLDSGTVVINGERAALDLQVAEGKN
jgi:hypothetical protein